MKKVIVTAAALCALSYGWARELQVVSVEQVAMPEGYTAAKAVLSPNGQLLGVSHAARGGVDCVNLATNTLTRVSEAGTLSQARFTADGTHLVFRSNQYRDNRRYVSVQSFDAATATTAELVAPTRNLHGLTVVDATVVVNDNGRIKARTVNGDQSAVTPSLSIVQGRLYLTQGNKTVDLSPLGNKASSYLWPSLSPDGKRVAFYAVGHGAFVCNLDGTGLRPLGMLQAISWLDDETVIGMDDRDNGIHTVESYVVAVDAETGAQQRLTDANHVALFPTGANGKIAFTDPDGKVFMLTYK